MILSTNAICLSLLDGSVQGFFDWRRAFSNIKRKSCCILSVNEQSKCLSNIIPLS
jgi:hypothetical protein